VFFVVCGLVTDSFSYCAALIDAVTITGISTFRVFFLRDEDAADLSAPFFVSTLPRGGLFLPPIFREGTVPKLLPSTTGGAYFIASSCVPPVNR